MASPPEKPLELDLLCQTLKDDYTDRITATGKDDSARRSNFLSKAVAAFVLHEAAGATREDAVAASIDGGADHGIDSVFIAADHTIWLVQSKYIDSGTGEPVLGDVSKFRDGVTDLLRGKWERFNKALQARQPEIERTLNGEKITQNDPAGRQGGTHHIKVILAYTGTAISDDRRAIFEDLEQAFNGMEPGYVRCFAYGLTTLHELLLKRQIAPPIEAELELHDYGQTQCPYRAVYGRMNAGVLAQLWARHGTHLVERNIRHFKGSTQVNEGLCKTLEQEAEHFFYFNNGVTFLCESLRWITPRDPTRGQGRLKVKGLSIINGAQTAGVIAKHFDTHCDSRPAEVMATIVCLENAPDNFGERVTQSRNRQNAVDLEDFAALDERQSNWQNTLRMAGLAYLVKQGEDDPPLSDTCFSARELAPYLACTITASDWPDYIIAAKTDKKKLFGCEGFISAKDPLHQAYTTLFADSLTTRRMWRIVQMSRAVLAAVKGRTSEPDPATLPPGTLPAKEILSHAKWLILHVVFIRQKAILDGIVLTLTDAEKQTLSREVDLLANTLVSIVQASLNWGKQARALFENRNDCRTVKASLMAALAQQN